MLFMILIVCFIVAKERVANVWTLDFSTIDGYERNFSKGLMLKVKVSSESFLSGEFQSWKIMRTHTQIQQKTEGSRT